MHMYKCSCQLRDGNRGVLLQPGGLQCIIRQTSDSSTPAAAG